MVGGLAVAALVVAIGFWAFRDDAQRSSASEAAGGGGGVSTATASSSPAVDPLAGLAGVGGTLNATLGGDGDTWSVAAQDLQTGAVSAIGATSGMYTGSIMKVMVLETLLRTQGGVDALSEGEQATAINMIEHSDNDAALTLWDDAGGDDALAETGAMLGLKNTYIEPNGYFGISTTSAADQLAVLHELLAPTFLSTEDALYVRSLMSKVESDQRWGVGGAADPGTPFENKNGWLNNLDDGGLWLINSIGEVTIAGRPFLLAVLTQHQPDFDTGVERINEVTAAIGAAMR